MEFLQRWSEPEPACLAPHRDLQPDLKTVQWKINRLVLRHVTRLHHLQENWLVSSAADLAPVEIDDGELVSPLELLPARDFQPDHALLRKEALVEFHKLKLRFEMFLGRELPLISLLELHCNGISKPKTLATHLKLSVRAVENLQKRLRRKWRAFSCALALSSLQVAGQTNRQFPANRKVSKLSQYVVTG